VQRWDLRQIETPGGKTSPVVLHSGEARAVLIALQPGQRLGDHEVKEATWVLVVEGAAQFEDDAGEAVEATAGMLLHFEPTERRAVESAEGARLLLLLAPWPGVGHYRAEEAAVG
jgi:quercetin dioxygenase-like cupin family protein